MEAEVSEKKEPELEDVQIGFSACFFQLNVKISRIETDIEAFLGFLTPAPKIMSSMTKNTSSLSES